MLSNARLRLATGATVVAIALGVVLAGCGSDDAPKPADPQAAAGFELVQRNCAGCHSLDGSKRAGPSFKGIYNSQVQLSDGRTVTADDAYLDRAIRDPDAEIVDGYSKGIMTAAVKKGEFTEEQTQQIVAYLKTIN